MPIPSGFGLAQFIFEGAGAGPGGCMVTLALDHPFDESPTVLAEEVSEAFAANMIGGLCDEVTHSTTRLRIGTPLGEVVVEVAGGGPGGQSVPCMPPSVALPFVKFSAFGGRANRGRWFLPGVPEEVVDSAGFIDSAARDDYTGNSIAFVAALAVDDFVPVILHSDPELTPTVVLSILCGAKVYTRGSRLR